MSAGPVIRPFVLSDNCVSLLRVAAHGENPVVLAGLPARLKYAGKHLSKGPNGNGTGSRYRLRPHSLRKFFRTQFGAKISQDTTEFFMGHKTSTYLDVAGRGLEELRQEYAKAGVTIRPKAAVDARDTIREMIKRLGGDPDKADLEGVFGHRTVIEGKDADLRDALRDVLLGMLREKA